MRHPSVLVLVASLAASVAIAGCTKASNSKSADDPKKADVTDSAAKSGTAPVVTAKPKPKPKPKKPMTIQVPVTASHKTCYDSLEKDAPKLVAGFKQDAVKLANEAGKGWDRFDKVLAKSDELWAAFLKGGGSPRAAESSWNCVVGDLSEALVRASIADLAGAPAADRKSRLDALEKIVEGKLANAPNNTSMVLAIAGARSGK